MLASRHGFRLAAAIVNAPWERQHFYIRAIILRGEYLLDRELRQAIEQQMRVDSASVGPPLPTIPSVADEEREAQLWEAQDRRRPPAGVAPSLWHRYCKGEVTRRQVEDAVAESAGTMTASSSLRGDASVNVEHAERMGFTVREV